MKQTKEILLTDQISEHYSKFFKKFDQINTLPVDQWNTIHVLAYLCNKYEQHYGIKYSFKFNNPTPSKSYEVYQIKKLANMLSSRPNILKDYLDWVFKNKIIEKKKRITALGYFTHPEIVNEYKFKFLITNMPILPKRSDSLPNNVISACSRHGFDIRTYAELAFIKKLPNQDSLFNELQSISFHVDLLDKIA